MPEFDSTGPIEVVIDLPVGDVRITAGDTPGTTVEVRPADPAREQDVRYAENTTVDFTNGRLLIKGPMNPVLSFLRPVVGPFGKGGGVAVEITVATGSRLDVEGGVVHLNGAGTFGVARVKVGVGDVHLEHVASLAANTGGGVIDVRTVDGDAAASTGVGKLLLGDVGAGAQLKNASGESRVDSVGGDLYARSSNGVILVGRAAAGVDAATANGDIRVGEVGPGTVALKTAVGELEVGIPEGLPAYLDVHTSFGAVQNRLTESSAPFEGEAHVEIRARTSFGDVVIKRP